MQSPQNKEIFISSVMEEAFYENENGVIAQNPSLLAQKLEIMKAVLPMLDGNMNSLPVSGDLLMEDTIKAIFLLDLKPEVLGHRIGIALENIPLDDNAIDEVSSNSFMFDFVTQIHATLAMEDGGAYLDKCFEFMKVLQVHNDYYVSWDNLGHFLRILSSVSLEQVDELIDLIGETISDEGPAHFNAFWNFVLFLEAEHYDIDWRDLRKYASVFGDYPIEQLNNLFEYMKRELKNTKQHETLLDFFAFEESKFSFFSKLK